MLGRLLSGLLLMASLTLPVAVHAQGTDAAELQKTIFPAEVTAKLTPVVDEAAGRVYIRLVLTNTGSNTYTIPIYLEKYPYFETSTLLLKHVPTGNTLKYPGDISVTWKKDGPVLGPGQSYDTTFSLTAAWFDATGEWKAVWQRAKVSTASGEIKVTGWSDASPVETFTLSAGFGG